MSRQLSSAFIAHYQYRCHSLRGDGQYRDRHQRGDEAPRRKNSSACRTSWACEASARTTRESFPNTVWREPTCLSGGPNRGGRREQLLEGCPLPSVAFRTYRVIHTIISRTHKKFVNLPRRNGRGGCQLTISFNSPCARATILWLSSFSIKSRRV